MSFFFVWQTREFSVVASWVWGDVLGNKILVVSLTFFLNFNIVNYKSVFKRLNCYFFYFKIVLDWHDRSFHFDCSGRTSQLGTSSVNAGLIVQVGPASSARLQSTLVWLFKSDQPARHIFSQHWCDCSSRTSQLGTPSLKATYVVWMINASRLHAPGTDKLHPRSTRGRTEDRWPMGSSGSRINGLRIIRHRPISPTQWWL